MKYEKARASFADRKTLVLHRCVCVCAHGFINSFLSARRWYFSTASHNLAHTLPAARCHTPTARTSIVPGPSFSDQWPSDSWFVLRQLHHWRCTQSFGFVRYASFFRPKTQRPSFRFSKEPLSTRWPLITPGQSLTLYGGFLKSGYPHSWMVYKYNGKIHSNGWFGGTPISGNLHMSGKDLERIYSSVVMAWV